MEKSCTKFPADREAAELTWFTNLLWTSFPEAQSERELCDLVSDVLSTEKRSIHWKTVRGWLRQETTPNFRYVVPVIAMAGAECIFQIIDNEGEAA